ncbi:glycosyltransferase [Spirillospora sp. NPDC047279]|uniref:glycosyltransferase n=1 Tax=Spirillospora sp. NPDC047279 TaxID=3155478 RepID=UPI0033FED716
MRASQIERTAERPASVDIAIPVRNGERALEGCVRALHEFLSRSFPLPWRITIVDAGSTDATWSVAIWLATMLDGVHVRRIERQGKGAAVRAAWLDSPADIVAYMDAGLSTGPSALPRLVAPLAGGHSEIAVGSRLSPGTRAARRWRRAAVSRAYNALLRLAFDTRSTDAACGFKAARSDVAHTLLPRVADDGWFFDTELLLLGEYNGLRIHEVPVGWEDDPGSRDGVARLVVQNVKGVLRTAREISTGRGAIPRRSSRARRWPSAPALSGRGTRLAKLLPFALIGIASADAHLASYLLLRTWWEPAAANLVAAALAFFPNAEANRRWTFRRPAGSPLRVLSRAAMLFLLTYASTSGAVLLIPAGAGLGAEAAALVAGAALTTAFRFTALDRWVFARPPAHRRRGARRRRAARH